MPPAGRRPRPAGRAPRLPPPHAAPVTSPPAAHYATEAEGAVNEQINVEYNISIVYHSMSAYFDRDNVGLPGLARYFRTQSKEERDHAQKLMDFQNTRGGRVALQTILAPLSEFNDAEKGDAL